MEIVFKKGPFNYSSEQQETRKKKIHLQMRMSHNSVTWQREYGAVGSS